MKIDCVILLDFVTNMEGDGRSSENQNKAKKCMRTRKRITFKVTFEQKSQIQENEKNKKRKSRNISLTCRRDIVSEPGLY